MTFGDAKPKGEGRIVDEYRELSDKEKLSQAREYIKSLKKQVDATAEDSLRYRRLRQLEVVIMAEDGAKYLKGKELDDYLDNLAMRSGLRRADILKELLPGLNQMFGMEYQKYQDTLGDEIAAHIDSEALNDKT